QLRRCRARQPIPAQDARPSAGDETGRRRASGSDPRQGAAAIHVQFSVGRNSLPAMNITKRQQVLAIAAAAIVGFFVLDKLVITPLTRSWKERSTTIADLRKSNAQGREHL